MKSTRVVHRFDCDEPGCEAFVEMERPSEASRGMRVYLRTLGWSCGTVEHRCPLHRRPPGFNVGTHVRRRDRKTPNTKGRGCKCVTAVDRRALERVPTRGALCRAQTPTTIAGATCR